MTNRRIGESNLVRLCYYDEKGSSLSGSFIWQIFLHLYPVIFAKYRRSLAMNIFMLLLIVFMSIVGGASTLYVVIGMPLYLIWKFTRKEK